MLKPQDIVVLCKLAGRDEPWTIASVGGELDLAASAVHRSLQRVGDAGLWDRRSRRVDEAALHELLVHGIRYLIPMKMLGPARGVPTAWSATPLRDALAGDQAEPVVWAHPKGSSRGTAIEPIHPCAAAAALRDAVLHERLALIDALRAGGPRIRREAAAALSRTFADRAVRSSSPRRRARATSSVGTCPADLPKATRKPNAAA